MSKIDIRKSRVKNTKRAGVLEFLVYRHKSGYIGVCLTLNIVEEGKNAQKLMESLKEAARGHVMLVIKRKLNDDLLNRPAPDKYWEIYWDALERLELHSSVRSPYYTQQIPLRELAT